MSRAASRPAAAQAAIAGAVSALELKATITRLVAFGTRHTLSDTTSPTRGIGAARRWTRSRFEAISRDCGGCLAVQTPAETITAAPRVPAPTVIEDVLAIQRGTSDPGRVLVISAHIDSRVTDVMNATADAPGANDDASGVAAVIEVARVLSKRKFPATIVYAVLSGEEQGLHGARVLAHYAAAQGWRVEAVLNNDIVGNTHGQSGAVIDRVVRVFAEGTRSEETETEAKKRRYNGGEVDSPSRNLARYVAGLAPALNGFGVRMVYRTDRYSRGGDQVPMLEAGYPAVRLTEGEENYDRQHQDVRTENGRRYGDTIEGLDFAYLAQVTRLNALALASLASAPAPPEGVDIKGAVSADTTISWRPSPGAAGYRVWWRETTAPVWEHSQSAGAATTLTLPKVNIDDLFFGVSAVAADGSESPVVFPGAAGAFFPVVASPVSPR